jgi:hypothetical protein
MMQNGTNNNNPIINAPQTKTLYPPVQPIAITNAQRPQLTQLQNPNGLTYF